MNFLHNIKSLHNQTARALILGCMLWLLPMHVQAWEPNAKDRNAAIDAGDLTGYFAKLTDWLDQKVATKPDQISKDKLHALLEDRQFVNALAERHFMAKAWVEPSLGGWAKADPKNAEFLKWVMSYGRIMEEVMLVRTPSAMFARIDDSHNIDTGVLENWKNIYHADPKSKKGIYLKLAIATVLRPPGTGNQGAGTAKKQSTVLDRYMHYREAHANKELFPSFDTLSPWELTLVVSSGASNADLAWGREAVNTWIPDFKQNENVVALTGQMRYTGSQIPYNDFSCLLAGGGKCGPRSSFGVFINQSFGIPSTGVAQPAHAAIAYRNRNAEWQVCYGKGWNVSKVFDRYKMSAGEFLQRVDERHTGKFAQVEHLRWLAALIEKPVGTYLPPAHRRYANARATAVMHAAQDEKKPDVVRGIIDPGLFVNKPDKKSPLKSFEAPESAGDHFAARIRGFLHPPKSGEYHFRIAADDYADLFLSTDDKPENKVQIAHVGIYTDARQFDKRPAQTSKPIRLEAGKRYLIEALQTETAGGDNLAVAWTGPGVTDGVIPAKYLSPYTQPDTKGKSSKNGKSSKQALASKKGSIVREVWDGSSRRPPVAVKFEPKPEVPIKVAPGVIHIEAEDFVEQGGIGGYGYPGVPILDCYQGGKQVFFGAMMQAAWVGYKIDVPKTGDYELTARVAAVNWGQKLHFRTFGAMYPVENATASEVFGNQFEALGPQKAVDNNLGTRWAMSFGKDQGWIELDLGQPRKISKVMIDERNLNSVARFEVEYKVGDDWKLLFEGDRLEDFRKEFPQVTAQFVRLSIFDTRAQTGGPTIREFSVGDKFDNSGWINIDWSPATAVDESADPAETKPGVAGRWQTSKPQDVHLLKGERTIWISAPSQRGVAMRWLQLTPKGD